MNVDSRSSSWKEEQGGARDMGRRHLIERRGTVWFPIWVNDPWVCQTPNMLGGLRVWTRH